MRSSAWSTSCAQIGRMGGGESTRVSDSAEFRSPTNKICLGGEYQITLGHGSPESGMRPSACPGLDRACTARSPRPVDASGTGAPLMTRSGLGSINNIPDRFTRHERRTGAVSRQPAAQPARPLQIHTL